MGKCAFEKGKVISRDEIVYFNNFYDLIKIIGQIVIFGDIEQYNIDCVDFEMTLQDFIRYRQEMNYNG